MYGIKSVHDTEPAGASGGGEEGAEEEEEVDIEAAIRKEVAALTAKPDPGSASSSGDGRMTPVKMNVDCLLFVKTPSAVDPVPFVRRICEDAMRCEEIPDLMRCRYVNRVTPVSVMGKANEQGLLEVAKEAMGKVFDLSGKRSLVVGGEGPADAAPSKEAAGETGAPEGEASDAESRKKPFTASQPPLVVVCWLFQVPTATRTDLSQFAIRPTIRNHSNLKRDVVINTIAGLVNDDLHKVNLTAPDKVILVEIFQVRKQQLLGVEHVGGLLTSPATPRTRTSAESASWTATGRSSSGSISPSSTAKHERMLVRWLRQIKGSCSSSCSNGDSTIPMRASSEACIVSGTAVGRRPRWRLQGSALSPIPDKFDEPGVRLCSGRSASPPANTTLVGGMGEVPAARDWAPGGCRELPWGSAPAGMGHDSGGGGSRRWHYPQPGRIRNTAGSSFSYEEGRFILC